VIKNCSDASLIDTIIVHCVLIVFYVDIAHYWNEVTLLWNARYISFVVGRYVLQFLLKAKLCIEKFQVSTCPFYLFVNNFAYQLNFVSHSFYLKLMFKFFCKLKNEGSYKLKSSQICALDEYCYGDAFVNMVMNLLAIKCSRKTIYL
jgi:hypothetical protein